ncbi:MAG TPA: toll/interleukin-1 receptor domain-containing protein [Ktedonobacterales bacterium]|nr:toll/interleukin-1 receptor domain-containing protein [Ktedonobacterales bacterium]
MAQMQVFVSHSHKDDAFCQALVKGLRDAGADVWYDEHNMGSGRLGPTIERELRRRPVFIVVLSPAALGSEWVEDETRWAYGLYRKDRSRIMQPVTARPLTENDIWLFLQDFKRIEAPGLQPFPTGEAVRRLLHTLVLTPQGEAPAPTAPQPQERVDDLVERGKALMAQKRHADAILLLERASQLNPRSFDAWGNLGQALGEVGWWAEALAACDRALALNANVASVWNNRGVALRKLNREDEALVAYDRALDLNPSAPDAWNNKGWALITLKQYDEALAAFDQTLAVEPTYAKAWGARGFVLYGLLRYDEALAALDRALALEETAMRWTNKASTLRALGRMSEAEAAERRAMEMGG